MYIPEVMFLTVLNLVKDFEDCCCLRSGTLYVLWSGFAHSDLVLGTL